MSQPEQYLEVEVKFLVADLAAFRERLISVGGTGKRPRIYEHNIRFDTPDGKLLQKRQLLRLRQDTAVKVTFKGEPAIARQSEVKVREELEMTVDNLETTVLIFQRLGFAPVQVYEKYRETFQWGEVEIVLDEMPFGNFVELEGEETAIKAVAGLLGLKWEQRILDNYLNMMAQVKTRYNLPFNDLTFANFQDITIDLTDIFGKAID
ncbi:MAG: class IV adenylate cyclase [Chloroflexi bacterium]|nr:class IV adenylate cyclase [Chloroflexota bacterium]